MTNRLIITSTKVLLLIIVVGGMFVLPITSWAANLLTSPATGVYSLSGTFTVTVVVNTRGQSINAAEGVISFNPRELSVVRVDRSSSVFNLWVTEPTFSNSAGTISFSGGSPTGYSGSAGTVFTVTFRSLTAGQTRVSYTSGSVLANDGRGTNVLSSMSGGTYTIEAATSQPAPEVVIEYVAPANTPAAPRVTSSSHADPAMWYQSKSASLAWVLPEQVTAVRTLLDRNPNSIPTRVYETPISSIELDELPEGESYFHIQFRNADGWGRVTHYRLAVDSIDPVGFSVETASLTDSTNPTQQLQVSFADEENGSPIQTYRISVNGGEPSTVTDTEETRLLTLPTLPPGYHTVAVEAVDAAGNISIDTISFTITSFEAPKFTEYPTELNPDVIPIFKGTTRPGAMVEVLVGQMGSNPEAYTIRADDSGSFIYIPESRFEAGVYQIKARATDEYGAQSVESAPLTFAVQQPGYIRLGSWLVNTLSVVVPLIALVMLLIISLLWFKTRVSRFKGRVSKESHDVVAILEREFTALNATILAEKEALAQSKRSKKLSEAESAFFSVLERSIKGVQSRVEKEVEDVERLVTKKDI
jgi:hypothetical protein